MGGYPVLRMELGGYPVLRMLKVTNVGRSKPRPYGVVASNRRCHIVIPSEAKGPNHHAIAHKGLFPDKRPSHTPRSQTGEGWGEEVVA